jgi:phage baseplate assembly protein W
MSIPNEANAFLGRGWSWPLRTTALGTPEQVAAEDDIRQAILIILGTNPGERVMRPEFGAGLRAFVFEPISMATITRIRNRVSEALINWEARIDLIEVRVTPAGSESNQLDIDIDYRVRGSNALHNLVYPFYLDEGTPR